jgi:hypothetical protein
MRLLPAGLFLAAGCFPQELLESTSQAPTTALVPSSAFGTMSPVSFSSPRPTYSPANQALAQHVSDVGQRILDANPEMGLTQKVVKDHRQVAWRPLFATYGTPKLELFHTGCEMVHITEGLVKRCKGDGQLAALLSLELAKTVSEREMLASPRMRYAEESPPVDVPIGNSAQLAAFDPVRQAELAHFDQRRRETQAKRSLAPPDPQKLARIYLERAGYNPTELDAVQPLVAEAQGNFALEKQVRQAAGNSAWRSAVK